MSITPPPTSYPYIANGNIFFIYRLLSRRRKYSKVRPVERDLSSPFEPVLFEEIHENIEAKRRASF